MDPIEAVNVFAGAAALMAERIDGAIEPEALMRCEFMHNIQGMQERGNEIEE